MEKKKIKHLAIILDGNRRWAKKRKLPVWKGHERGVKKVKELIEWCKEKNIKELTIYVFSSKNFSRKKKEKKEIFRILKEGIEKTKKEKDIKICFAGKIERFPNFLQKSIREIERKTRNNKGLRVNICLGYDGREEIIEAIRKLIKKRKKINEKSLREELWVKNEPDLIIRTGGEKRMSGFLLWQLSYSELYFIKKFWPDFTKKDFLKAIKEFEKRERRFGK